MLLQHHGKNGSFNKGEKVKCLQIKQKLDYSASKRFNYTINEQRIKVTLQPKPYKVQIVQLNFRFKLIEHGNVAQVKRVLDTCDVVNMIDPNGASILHHAARSDRADILRNILDRPRASSERKRFYFRLFLRQLLKTTKLCFLFQYR